MGMQQSMRCAVPARGCVLACVVRGYVEEAR